MILARFLIAFAILCCCVHAQGGSAARSAGGTITDRAHSRVQRKIDLIDKIASNRRISAKLVRAQAQLRGDGSPIVDDGNGSAWVKTLSARVSNVRQNLHKRMVNLHPAGQANRANSDRTANNKDGRSSSSTTGVQMRLGRHGDASVVAKDVAYIASQQLPRNTIVEHLRRKFPLLESGEVNDVIVAAHLHLGKSYRS